MSKTQTRGNCPCCGREQAVLNAGRGSMSQHGYTVKNGWFNGVCPGDRHAPMQVQREVTDAIVRGVREEVKALEARAAELRQGINLPEFVAKPNEYVHRGEQPTMVKLAELGPYDQRQVIASLAFQCEARARAGTGFANDMEKLVNAVHGTALKVVTLEAGPAPIRTGEKRRGLNGSTLVARYAERGRVYWTRDTDGFKGWDGVQAWRRRDLVEG